MDYRLGSEEYTLNCSPKRPLSPWSRENNSGLTQQLLNLEISKSPVIMWSSSEKKIHCLANVLLPQDIQSPTWKQLWGPKEKRTAPKHLTERCLEQQSMKGNNDDGLKELEVVHNNNMTKNKEHISPAEPIEAIRMELNTSTNDVSPHDKGIPPTWLKTELQSTLNEE